MTNSSEIDRLKELGAKALATMEATVGAQVLSEMSKGNQDSARLAAQILVDLIRLDRPLAGQIKDILMDRDFDGGEVMSYVSHDDYHRLVAASKGIPVEQTYWQ
jgi:hypothetical protein